MNSLLNHPFGPRLLAGFGTVTLLAGIGLFASRPARSVGGPVAVSVANTPLSTTTADNPDKQGVQFAVDLTFAQYNTIRTDTSAYVVPTGKRLVIETVSATSKYSSADGYSITYLTNGGLESQQVVGHLNISPEAAPYAAGDSHPHQYAEAGSAVNVTATRSSGSINLIGEVYIAFTGYLVDIATPGGSS